MKENQLGLLFWKSFGSSVGHQRLQREKKENWPLMWVRGSETREDRRVEGRIWVPETQSWQGIESEVLSGEMMEERTEKKKTRGKQVILVSIPLLGWRAAFWALVWSSHHLRLPTPRSFTQVGMWVPSPSALSSQGEQCLFHAMGSSLHRVLPQGLYLHLYHG